MNVAGRRVALGEEKGLFPVLVDSDVHDEDGVTKKFTFAAADKDIAGLEFRPMCGAAFREKGRRCWRRHRGGEDSGARLLAMHHRDSVGCGR